jgi:hypothetical protein
MFNESIVFNTGCRYDRRGQVISVAPYDAGRGIYVMVDHSRGISYVYQFDFDINSASALEYAIMKRYLRNGPEYAPDTSKNGVDGPDYYMTVMDMRKAIETALTDDNTPDMPGEQPEYFYF